MQNILVFIFVVLAPLKLTAFSISTGSFSCQRSSSQLGACVKEGLVKALARFKDGDVELGVPSLEPLELPYLTINHDSTNLTLDITMRNVLISGFTDIRLAKVTVNLEDANKLEISGKTPALHFTGQYLSEGFIVSFPLHSAGSFAINMTDVTSAWVVYLKENNNNGTKFLQIDGFNIEMMPVSTSFRAAEQLDGDNRLGEAVNVILNENSSEMYSLIKDKLAEVLSGLLTELANQVLSQVSEATFLRP